MGSGYTVEGQKTSKEQHGGLQIEITPELLPKRRLWSFSKDKYIVKSARGFSSDLDEMKTPEQLGRDIGDVLRSYPTDSTYEVPLKAKHLAEPGTDIKCKVSRAKTYVGFLLTHVFKAIGRLSHLFTYCSGGEFAKVATPIEGFPTIESPSYGFEKEVVTDNTNKELETNDARDISAMGLAAGGKLSRAR